MQNFYTCHIYKLLLIHNYIYKVSKRATITYPLLLSPFLALDWGFKLIDREASAKLNERHLMGYNGGDKLVIFFRIDKVRVRFRNLQFS